MAKVVAFANRLRQVLRQGLREAGIEAKVQVEPIRGTKLHRVIVVADGFEKLRPSERQDLVWRIIDRKPEFADEQLRISMIYTLTNDELPE